MGKKGHQSEQNTWTLVLKVELSTPSIEQIMIRQIFTFACLDIFLFLVCQQKNILAFHLLHAGYFFLSFEE